LKLIDRFYILGIVC